MMLINKFNLYFFFFFFIFFFFHWKKIIDNSDFNIIFDFLIIIFIIRIDC